MSLQEDENLLRTAQQTSSGNTESRLSIPLTPLYSNNYKTQDAETTLHSSSKRAAAEKLLSRAEAQRDQATAALGRIQTMMTHNGDLNGTTELVPMTVQRVSPGHFVLPAHRSQNSYASFTPQGRIETSGKESLTRSASPLTTQLTRASVTRKDALLPFARYDVPSANALDSPNLQAMNLHHPSSASKRLSALQNRHQHLLKEVEELEKSVASAKTEKKIAMERVDSAEQVFLDIQRRTKELQTNLKEAESLHRDRMMQIEMERKDLETRLEESRKQALDCQQEVVALQHKAETLQGACIELEIRLSNTKTLLDEATRRKDSLDKYISEATVRLEEKEKAIAESQRRWDVIEARCAQAESKLVEVSARLDAKRAMVEDAERRLQDVQASVVVKEDEPEVKGGKGHPGKECEAGLSMAYDWLQYEFQSMRDERDRLKHQLDIERDATQKAKQLGEEIESSFRTNIANIATSRSIWEAEREGRLVAEERAAELESQLVDAQAKIQTLEGNVIHNPSLQCSPQPWSMFVALFVASCMLKAQLNTDGQGAGIELDSSSLQKEVSDMESLVLMLRRRFVKQNQLIHGLRLQVDTLKNALRVESMRRIVSNASIDQSERDDVQRVCPLSELRRDKIARLTRSLLASSALNATT